MTMGLKFKKFTRGKLRFMMIHEDFKFSRPILVLDEENMNALIDEWRKK